MFGVLKIIIPGFIIDTLEYLHNLNNYFDFHRCPKLLPCFRGFVVSCFRHTFCHTLEFHASSLLAMPPGHAPGHEPTQRGNAELRIFDFKPHGQWAQPPGRVTILSTTKNQNHLVI